MLIFFRNPSLEKLSPKEELDCIGSDIDGVAEEPVGDSDQIDEEFRVRVVAGSNS